MEKVAQQELCLLFALIDMIGRRCPRLQVFQVAILKGNIYRVALWDSVYFAEILHDDAK